MLQREVEVALIVMRLARTWVKARRAFYRKDTPQLWMAYRQAEAALIDEVVRCEEEQQRIEARLPF